MSPPVDQLARRSTLPKWRWFLADSRDLSVIAPLDKARSRSLKPALNKPGSASFTLDTTERAAQEAVAVQTCLLATRNGRTIFSGPIWTIDDSIPDVTFNCLGWFEELNHRLLKCGPQAPPAMPTSSAVSHTYAAKDAGSIAVDLLQRTNLEVASHITVGRLDVSNYRNITYQIYQNVGQAITSLSNIEGGFDFAVDPATRALDIYWSLVKGSIYGRGTNRPDVVWGYRAGPSNLVDKTGVKRTIDASKLVNQEIAAGVYGVVAANDVVSQAANGLYSENQSLANVVDPGILLAFANAEVAVKAQPMIIYTLNPLPSGQGRVPQPFDDYDLGDITYLVANYGRLQVGLDSDQGQAVRIFGFDLAIDDNGLETVSGIQTVFS